VLTFLLNTETVLHVRDLEDLGEIDVSLFEHDGDTYLAEPGMFLHDGDAVLAVVRTGDLPALAPYMKG
jgi:Trk K+ transport system NAD-binding subunit